MARTRILTTIGPASCDPSIIQALLAAGTDAFRLNFSHGDLASHEAAYRNIRSAATSLDRHVAIVQDLPGPKIRIGTVEPPLTLKAGDALTIERGTGSADSGAVCCDFDALFTSVQPGQRLLVDDGTIELEVVAIAPGRFTTRVLTDGVLQSHKGINVPGAPIRTAALTPRDIEDLRAGIAMGVDMVAISFVQSAADVRAARAAAASFGAPDLPIIAKIEKPQAVDDVEEILTVADGLMVARGDLGIEIPLETLPAVQKRLIQAARRRGVPVIVATQVLESMRTSPRPTRAEVTDAAHAVDEGVDAIMLAGETAAGRYPVRAVETLEAIIREAEKSAIVRLPFDGTGGAEHGRAICEAAVALADRARASAIVALTEAGKTALLLAALRPAARILAATPSVRTAARCGLLWGVEPIVCEPTTLSTVRERLIARAILPQGAIVVYVAMQPAVDREGTNFVHVERL
jgi:pyruvate kinase